MDHEALNLTRRKLIFSHIKQYPGSYIREMEKTLSLSLGDLQYHLQQLEKADSSRPRTMDDAGGTSPAMSASRTERSSP